jgi:hypothetical protein
MSNRLTAAAALVVAIAAASAANAAVTHDYQLNNSLADAVSGGADIVNRAGPGSLGLSGITFGSDLGPTIGGYSNTGIYSIETRFSFNEVDGYNNILDFKSGGDQTFYVLDGRLNFFPIVTSAGPLFAVGELHHFVVTRDSAATVTAYVDGVQALSFFDASDRAMINSELRFFNDDGIENSPGFVDYIRTYDTALGASDVATLARGGSLDGGVPEPAAWALMILGFGGVGAVMRRRGVAAA